MSDRIEAAEAILATCAAARGRISTLAHQHLPFGAALAVELAARVGQSPEREAIRAWQEMLALETRIWRGPSAGELSVALPDDLAEPIRPWVSVAAPSADEAPLVDDEASSLEDAAAGQTAEAPLVEAAAAEADEESPDHGAAEEEPEEDAAEEVPAGQDAPADAFDDEDSLPPDDETDESGEFPTLAQRPEPEPEPEPHSEPEVSVESDDDHDDESVSESDFERPAEPEPEPVALEATQPDGDPFIDIDDSAFDLPAVPTDEPPRAPADDEDVEPSVEDEAIAAIMGSAGELPSPEEVEALVAGLAADVLDDDEPIAGVYTAGEAVEEGPRSLLSEELELIDDEEESPGSISLSISVQPEDDDDAPPRRGAPPSAGDTDVATRARGLGAALAASLSGSAARSGGAPAGSEQPEPPPKRGTDRWNLFKDKGAAFRKKDDEDTMIPELAEDAVAADPQTLPPVAVQPIDAVEEAPDLQDLPDAGDDDDLSDLPDAALGAPHAVGAAAVSVAAPLTAEDLALGAAGEELVDDEEEAAAPAVEGGGFSVHFERPEGADEESEEDLGPRLTEDADMSLASTTGPPAPDPTEGVAGTYDPDDLDRFRALARQAEEGGDLQAAILHYGDILDLVPDAIEGYIGRGRAQMELGDFAAAMSDFQRAEDINPESPDPMVEMGNLFFARKDYLRAIELYDHAIEMDPSHAMARCRRGICHHYRRDHKKAFQDLQRAYALDPEIPNIRKYVQMAVKAMERTDR